MMEAMEKDSLRKEKIALRNGISPIDRIVYARAILARITKSEEFQRADAVLLYADYKGEVPTREIFDAAVWLEKDVYFPKVADGGKGGPGPEEVSDNGKELPMPELDGCLEQGGSGPKRMDGAAIPKMEFYQIGSYEEFIDGYKGILEPEGTSRMYRSGDYEKPFMVVPGAVFGENGYRIGYGRGYYDRYLARHPEIYACGICFQSQMVKECPHDGNDIRMDWIITEGKGYKF